LEVLETVQPDTKAAIKKNPKTTIFAVAVLLDGGETLGVLFAIGFSFGVEGTSARFTDIGES
jgi:hypothetical protein